MLRSEYQVHSVLILVMEFTASNLHNCKLGMQVIAQIEREQLLPWEDPIAASLQSFGLLQDACLEALERNPDARPSMREYMPSCRQVLAVTTSQS